MEKNLEIVMLPQTENNDGNERQLLYSDTYSDYAYDYQSDVKSLHYQTQHLYLVADESEKIKDGDWFINTDGLWQHNGEIEPNCNPRKVIASTVKLLFSGDYKNSDGYIPLIPEWLVEKYVDEEGKIKEVMVEFEPLHELAAKNAIDVVKVNEENEVIARLLNDEDSPLNKVRRFEVRIFNGNNLLYKEISEDSYAPEVAMTTIFNRYVCHPSSNLCQNNELRIVAEEII
jgi:hypothetical protein